MADLADEQNDNAPSNDGDGGADAQAIQPVVPPAAPSSSSSSAARQAQLAQLKELQAKLDEQRQPKMHGYGYVYRIRYVSDTRIRYFKKNTNTRIRIQIF